MWGQATKEAVHEKFGLIFFVRQLLISEDASNFKMLLIAGVLIVN